MTLEDKLIAAEARLAELEGQLAAQLATNAELQQRLHEATTARQDESAVVGQLQGELKTLRQENQQQLARVAQLEAEAKSAEARAATICASVGVEPLPVTPQGDRDASDLTEQLKAQPTPAAQTAFWRKHKDRILNRS